MNDKTLVAVYGTLKNNFGNHHVMRAAGGEYVGTTRVPNFCLVDLGPFPAAMPEPNSNILVEVYEVQDMDPLDALEGYPHFYDRDTIQTEFGTAWIYFQEHPVGNVIPNGCWGEDPHDEYEEVV